MISDFHYTIIECPKEFTITIVSQDVHKYVFYQLNP